MSVPVRVLTYNVRSLRDDADAVAAILRELAPDLACIQEAPRFLFSTRKCVALAAAGGMTVLAGGRAANGNLLLGGPRAQPLTGSYFRLPRAGRRHRRAVATATVEIDGVHLSVAGTHLSIDPLERLKQAKRIVERLGVGGIEPGPHSVLGGDINDVPGSEPWEILTGLLRDAYAVAPRGADLTFPARAPERRIDGLFVSADVTVVGCGVPENLPDPSAASDHLPVVVDLTVEAN